MGGLQSKSQRAVRAERRQIEAQGRQRKQLCETWLSGATNPEGGGREVVAIGCGRSGPSSCTGYSPETPLAHGAHHPLEGHPCGHFVPGIP